MLGGHEQIELAGLFPETQTMMAELPGLWIHAWAMTGDSQVLHDYMKLDTVHIDLDTRQVQSEFPGLPDCRPPSEMERAIKRISEKDERRRNVFLFLWDHPHHIVLLVFNPAGPKKTRARPSASRCVTDGNDAQLSP